MAERLGSILLKHAGLSEEHLRQAVEQQSLTGRRLGEVLVELGHVSPEQLAQAMATQLKIPYMELGEDFRLATEEVSLIPESVARKYLLVPMKKTEGPTMTIVMADPLDVEALDAVQTFTNMDVRRAVSTPKRILAVIDQYYKLDAHLERNLQDIVALENEESEKGVSVSADDPLESDQLRVQANDAPVVRFVNLVLMQAIRDRASDIHFEPAEREVYVRLRIDGALHDVTPPPRNLYQAIVTRIKILSQMDIAERRLPLDGRFKFKVHDRLIDIRVSSLPEVFGEKLVLRVLDRAALPTDLKRLGLEEPVRLQFEKVLRHPHGIILLTGPTGSGKTTTLYSALSFLKSREKNIQTVEDPVEYLIEGINQLQAKAEIGLTFAGALRAILRQDPDIIMIGEIRDEETASIAVRAALTGHLVLSSLHTNDATSTFSRLKDIGVKPYLIAGAIRASLSQRLIRVVCKECKREIEPTPEHLKLAVSVLGEDPGARHYQGAGCSACASSGYRGRQAILEFLEVTDGIREMILDNTGELSFRRKAMDMGMESLLVSGLKKEKQGVTTFEEVISVCPLDEIFI